MLIPSTSRAAAWWPAISMAGRLPRSGIYFPSTVRGGRCRVRWRTGIWPNSIAPPTWATGGYAEFVWKLLETFGVDRVLFGSNFPVDRRTITYAVLVAATLALTWQLTADERDRLFYRNTVRTYRINGPITNQTLRVWGLR